MQSPSGSPLFRAPPRALFLSMFLTTCLGGCGAAPTPSGIDAGGGGAAGGEAGADGGTATDGAAMTGGASGDGGRAGNGGVSGHGGAAGNSGRAGNGGVFGNGGRAGNGGMGGAPSCDSNGDGLDDVASCVTAPVYLRFVNATASETFDIYVSGAAGPVATGLAAYRVATVGPVQAKLLDYEFRASGASPSSKLVGETKLQANDRITLIAYVDPAGAGTLATNSALQPTAAGCAAGAVVDVGDFTSLTTTPVVVLYATGPAGSWTPAISPGLGIGQVLGSGCWNAGPSIKFGAGPAGATTPTLAYQAVAFTNGMTYQLLMTDDRIIEIDNLERVSNLPKL